MTFLSPLPLSPVASPSPPIPDPDTCWDAVQRRDRASNGRFWFSVRSTGVYCLPSCAARPACRAAAASLSYAACKFKAIVVIIRNVLPTLSARPRRLIQPGRL